jgi:threonine dehydrogenase-like Zn-dependent dehydrogenase
MKAAVVEKPGVLVIKEVPVPEISGNQVLIKVQVTSICNATDNHIFHGVFDGYHDFYPQILGHEVSGEIVEAGTEVKNLKLGDLVVLYSSTGAFCEYVAVDSNWPFMAKVPDTMPLKIRSLSEMLHGAYVSAVYPAQIKEHESVLIVGQGPMGLTATATAKLTAGKVFAVDIYESRVKKALEIGADVSYNRSEMSSGQIVDAIRKETGGEGVDVVIMCISEDRSTGLDAFDMAVGALKMGGRMTGLCVDAKDIKKNHRLDPHQFIRKEATFAHTLSNVCKTGEDIQRVFQEGVNLVAAGKINFDAFVTHEVGFDGLLEALKLCVDNMDEVIKVVVYPR